MIDTTVVQDIQKITVGLSELLAAIGALAIAGATAWYRLRKRLMDLQSRSDLNEVSK